MPYSPTCSSNLAPGNHQSVASSIFPAILPPLLPQAAIKFGLAQLNIDGVMSLAHPHA